MGHRQVEATHACLWLRALLSQYPQHNKGDLYISRFDEACEKLREEGKINDVWYTPRNGELDSSGVDAIVSDKKEVQHFFQVTSTLTHVRGHRKINDNHPERPPTHIIPIRQGDQPLLKPVHEVAQEIERRIVRGKYR